jgi:hypothetical protein
LRLAVLSRYAADNPETLFSNVAKQSEVFASTLGCLETAVFL